MSRRKSIASELDGKSLRRKSVVPDTMKESEEEDTEVANSRCLMRLEERANTGIAALSRKAATEDANTTSNGDNPVNLKTLLNCGLDSEDDTPFSLEELEKAVARALLKL